MHAGHDACKIARRGTFPLWIRILHDWPRVKYGSKNGTGEVKMSEVEPTAGMNIDPISMSSSVKMIV